MNRAQMSDEQIFKALEVVTHQVGRRLEKHGRGAFISKHETFGIVSEEYHELIDELRNDTDLTRFAEELMDVAVACVLGVASMISSEAPVMKTEQDIPADSIHATDLENLAVQARESLKVRAAQSGLVIPD